MIGTFNGEPWDAILLQQVLNERLLSYENKTSRSVIHFFLFNGYLLPASFSMKMSLLISVCSR